MQNSLADQFRGLPLEERQRRLSLLSPQEAKVLLHSWEWWRRPNQAVPPGDWITWLILAGRGFGKTRTGAETCRAWVNQGHTFVNLIGATADDARDIMIEGESGILSICPRSERPVYRKSERKLIWPSGAVSLVFTADEPERLRGKQHQKLWADELGAWRYPESWDQASLGLRLGIKPQSIVTTTPRPTKIVKALAKDPTTHVTTGSTYDNKTNLAGAFLSQIITRFEGTRLGRQELNAEILDDNPGALWHRDMIDNSRATEVPELVRVVVGVDPAVTSKEDSDLTGIVVAGRDHQYPPHFYIMADRSLTASPDSWAGSVVNAYHEFRADRVVAEVNNGGDLVETVIRYKDGNISFESVHATRGKQIRAEPIAALYEQGRVHHVGYFPDLEDQMCDWDPLLSEKSPDRMDALVWALTQLSDDSGMGFFEYLRQEAQKVEDRKNGLVSS